MPETDHFINAGYGWVCKHCSPPDAVPHDSNSQDEQPRARFLREGEAEEREPRLSTPALARWRDGSRQTLVCPRCSIEEALDKA